MAMNHKVVIKTDTAPPAIGPYSQAIKVDQMIFVSGQIPIDKEAKNIVGTDIAAQTRQCLENIRAILESTGAAMSQVVKTTVYLKDMGDFKQMNEAYKDFFQIDQPARACVEVSKLPGNVLVEIDAIAIMPPPPKPVEKGSLL